MSVIQDEETPEDWYLVLNDPDGFAIRDNTGEGMAFNNAMIVKTFIDCFDFNTTSVACKLAIEETKIKDAGLPKGVKLYAIITKTAQYKEIEEVKEAS